MHFKKLFQDKKKEKTRKLKNPRSSKIELMQSNFTQVFFKQQKFFTTHLNFYRIPTRVLYPHIFFEILGRNKFFRKITKLLDQIHEIPKNQLVLFFK